MAVRSRILRADPRLGSLVAYRAERWRGLKPVRWAVVTEVLQTPSRDLLTVRCWHTGAYAVLQPEQILAAFTKVHTTPEEAIALVAERRRGSMVGQQE